MKTRTSCYLLIALITALLAPGLTLAEEGPSQGVHFGVFAGYTHQANTEFELPSSIEEVDLEDTTFGVEIGWIENRLGISGSLSTFGDEAAAGDVDYFLAEVSVHWYFVRGENVSADVFGGPGWAFVDDGTGFDVDDGVAVHAGVGMRAGGEHAFFRPSVRARWIDGADLGYEARVGFGWQF